jgi:hypothetical protein
MDKNKPQIFLTNEDGIRALDLQPLTEGRAARCGAISSAIFPGWPRSTSPIRTDLPGCAYMGGLALGWFKDFDVLKSEWFKVSGVTEPNPETREQYDHAYRIYAELHTAFKPIFMKSALE